jgi:hypothetical protein
LLKVEALAECGVVEGEDGYEFVAETLLWCVASDAEFEVCAGLVKIAYEIKGARKEALFGSWNPGRFFTSATWD